MNTTAPLKRRHFIACGAGQPIVTFEFSYDDDRMYLIEDGIEKSVEIDEDQLSQLNSLAPNEQMKAAQVWGEASGQDQDAEQDDYQR